MGNALQQRATDFVEYVKSKEDDLTALLPPGIDPARFVRSAYMAVLRQPKLLEEGVSKRDLYSAIADSARYGLFPDGKEAAIIPYREDGKLRPRFQPMRGGLVKKILQNPDYVAVRAEPVREGDPFTHNEGLEPVLEHTPKEPPPENEDFDPTVIAAYAIVRHRDLPQKDSPFKVVYREEIERARNTGFANTPAWRNWYGEMASKVALRRLSKDLLLSDEAEELVRLDDMLEAGKLARPEDVRQVRGTARLEESEAAAEAGRSRLRELESEVARAKRGDEDGSTEPPSEADVGEAVSGDEPEEREEPTEEEKEKARESQRKNYLAWLDQMVEADDAPVDRQHVLDIAEEEFGDRDEVERNEAGFVDVEALSVDDLSDLVAKVADERGVTEPGDEDE